MIIGCLDKLLLNMNKTVSLEGSKYVSRDYSDRGSEKPRLPILAGMSTVRVGLQNLTYIYCHLYKTRACEFRMPWDAR
jgi:hypothetical protein